MRELKGDWRDLFNGFMLALDLRKMFLAFCGIVFSLFSVGIVTVLVGHFIDPTYVSRPTGFYLHEIWTSITQSWHVIFSGTPHRPADWKLYLPYSVFFVLMVLIIWSYFGGAIARIAAYEIAKDGERIETAKALRFAAKRFWAFFWAPLICAIGFAFFFLCNFIGGLIGHALDYAYIGAPLVALLLPLAILSGFIMTLILVGTTAGSPLFHPAVAAEGTDSFDAVSRGFSYVYSRPWHYIWYQGVSAVYGYVCTAFVILFAITMCHIGLSAGSKGFDLFGVWEPRSFDRVSNASWNMILSEQHADTSYNWGARAVVLEPHPYGRLQHLANRIVKPDRTWTIQELDSSRAASSEQKLRWHKYAAMILTAWLIVTLGLALGYPVSYFISQQTMIYYILRKKVDGIEMNEVYEEPEEEESISAPPEAAKPPESPVAAPVPEPPKEPEKK